MSNPLPEEDLLPQSPSRYPSAPAHELFDLSTTVDPSYVISLIRRLLPSDGKDSAKALGDGLVGEECKNDGRKENSISLPEHEVEAGAMDSSANYDVADGQDPKIDRKNHIASAVEETWNKCGCVLWDLSASEDHAKFMVENFILEVLLANLMVSESSRVTEISLGIIGNLACHDISRKKMASTNGLAKVIVDQLLLDDVPCLCEACRVLTLCLQGGEAIVWAESLQAEQILSRILWIAENALNPQLSEKSVGLLLAILESRREVIDSLLPPLMKLDLPSLLIKLLAYEMSILKEERVPDRYVVLDSILRTLEALSVIEDYSREICQNIELLQLVKELIELPDKFEVPSSRVTAAVLIANILSDATDLAINLSQDLNFLQSLFDVLSYTSDDRDAKSAIWSTIARLMNLVGESEMTPTNLRNLVSVVAGKLDTIEEELISRPLDQGKADTSSTCLFIAINRIYDFLTSWKELDMQVKINIFVEEDPINEDDIDKLLDVCDRALRKRA